MSKSELSFDELKKLSKVVSQILPNVEESVAALDEQINQGFEELETGQDKLEASFKADMQDLKSCMAELEGLKDIVQREDERQEDTRRQWQDELERAGAAVRKAIQVHLELQMQDLKLDIRTIVSQELLKSKTNGQASSHFSSTAALSLLGSGVAGAIGAMLARSTQTKSLPFEDKAVPVQTSEVFECKESKKVFHSDITLELHERGHLKPFECDHCHMRFSFELNLRTATQVHSHAG